VRQRKNQLSPRGEEKLIIAVRQRKNRLSPRGKEKIDYPREAKKKLIIAMRHESPSGGMKSILAVRQRKINYCCEAKKKSIIAVRRRKN
jgi:hypothetical protein